MDPFAELVEDGPTVAQPSLASLLGVVAVAAGLSLDREELRNDAYAVERDAVATAGGFDQAPSRVGVIPSSR
jgi:hypothetical protein